MTYLPGTTAIAISGSPIAGDIARWNSATSIGPSSAAAPAVGPLILRGPVDYYPLAHTNLKPRKTLAETPVDLVSYIHAARDAIIADGWPGVINLSGGIWDVQTPLIINSGKIKIKGVGPNESLATSGGSDSPSVQVVGTVIRAMDTFVATGEDCVVRCRRDARATITNGVPLEGFRLQDLYIDGNGNGTGNSGQVYDGLLLGTYNGLVENFAIGRCPGNGLYLLAYESPGAWAPYETQIEHFTIFYNSRSGIYFGINSTDMHLSHFTVYHNGVLPGTQFTDAVDIVNYGDGLQMTDGSANQLHDLQSYSNRRRGITMAQARTKLMGVKIENNQRGGIYFTGASEATEIGPGNFANNSQLGAGQFSDIQLGAGALGQTSVNIHGCNFANAYGSGGQSKYNIELLDSQASQTVITGCKLTPGTGAAVPETRLADRCIHINASISAADGPTISNCDGWSPAGEQIEPAMKPTYNAADLAGTSTVNRKGSSILINIWPEGASITELYTGPILDTSNFLPNAAPDGKPQYAVVIPSRGFVGIAYGPGAGAKTITNAVSNGGPDLIRITATAHGFSTGNRIAIQGVTGTTEANAVWTITVIDANTFDLQASVHTNAYVSGGSAFLAPSWMWVGL